MASRPYADPMADRDRNHYMDLPYAKPKARQASPIRNHYMDLPDAEPKARWSSTIRNHYMDLPDAEPKARWPSTINMTPSQVQAARAIRESMARKEARESGRAVLGGSDYPPASDVATYSTPEPPQEPGIIERFGALDRKLKAMGPLERARYDIGLVGHAAAAAAGTIPRIGRRILKAGASLPAVVMPVETASGYLSEVDRLLNEDALRGAAREGRFAGAMFDATATQDPAKDIVGGAGEVAGDAAVYSIPGAAPAILGTEAAVAGVDQAARSRAMGRTRLGSSAFGVARGVADAALNRFQMQLGGRLGEGLAYGTGEVARGLGANVGGAAGANLVANVLERASGADPGRGLTEGMGEALLRSAPLSIAGAFKGHADAKERIKDITETESAVAVVREAEAKVQEQARLRDDEARAEAAFEEIFAKRLKAEARARAIQEPSGLEVLAMGRAASSRQRQTGGAEPSAYTLHPDLPDATTDYAGWHPSQQMYKKSDVAEKARKSVEDLEARQAEAAQSSRVRSFRHRTAEMLSSVEDHQASEAKAAKYAETEAAALAKQVQDEGTLASLEPQGGYAPARSLPESEYVGNPVVNFFDQALRRGEKSPQFQAARDPLRAKWLQEQEHRVRHQVPQDMAAALPVKARDQVALAARLSRDFGRVLRADELEAIGLNGAAQDVYHALGESTRQQSADMANAWAENYAKTNDPAARAMALLMDKRSKDPTYYFPEYRPGNFTIVWTDSHGNTIQRVSGETRADAKRQAVLWEAANPTSKRTTRSDVYTWNDIGSTLRGGADTRAAAAARAAALEEARHMAEGLGLDPATLDLNAFAEKVGSTMSGIIAAEKVGRTIRSGELARRGVPGSDLDIVRTHAEYSRRVAKANAAITRGAEFEDHLATLRHRAGASTRGDTSVTPKGRAAAAKDLKLLEDERAFVEGGGGSRAARVLKTLAAWKALGYDVAQFPMQEAQHAIAGGTTMFADMGAARAARAWVAGQVIAKRLQARQVKNYVKTKAKGAEPHEYASDAFGGVIRPEDVAAFTPKGMTPEEFAGEVSTFWRHANDSGVLFGLQLENWAKGEGGSSAGMGILEKGARKALSPIAAGEFGVRSAGVLSYYLDGRKRGQSPDEASDSAIRKTEGIHNVSGLHNTSPLQRSLGGLGGLTASLRTFAPQFVQQLNRARERMALRKIEEGDSPVVANTKSLGVYGLGLGGTAGIAGLAKSVPGSQDVYEVIRQLAASTGKQDVPPFESAMAMGLARAGVPEGARELAQYGAGGVGAGVDLSGRMGLASLTGYRADSPAHDSVISLLGGAPGRMLTDPVAGHQALQRGDRGPLIRALLPRGLQAIAESSGETARVGRAVTPMTPSETTRASLGLVPLRVAKERVAGRLVEATRKAQATSTQRFARLIAETKPGGTAEAALIAEAEKKGLDIRSIMKRVISFRKVRTADHSAIDKANRILEGE